MDFILKIKDALNLQLKDAIFLAILLSIAFNTTLTAQTINNMEKREMAETTEASSAVLTTLKMQHLTTPEEIDNFLAPKPAGRTALKKGLRTDKVYVILLRDFGELAKNAKIALN